MTTGRFSPRYDRSFYGELGVDDRFTLGLDLNFGETGALNTGFVRYTVTPPDATWQLAFDFGAMQRVEDGMPDQSFARLGMSVGRGLAPGGGQTWAMPITHDGGWATLDAVGYFDMEGGDPIWQLEGTVGLTLQNGWRTALALKAEEWPGSDFLLSAAPSVMIEITERNTLQIGARVALDGSDSVGLTLNIWHEF